VIYQASVFSVMVMMATTTEAHRRVLGDGSWKCFAEELIHLLCTMVLRHRTTSPPAGNPAIGYAILAHKHTKLISSFIVWVRNIL
jgi:hypothetical protein